MIFEKNKRNSVDEIISELKYYVDKYNFKPRIIVQILNDFVMNLRIVDFEYDLPYLLYLTIGKITKFGYESFKVNVARNKLYFEHPFSTSENAIINGLKNIEFRLNDAVGQNDLYVYSPNILGIKNFNSIDEAYNMCKSIIKMINEPDFDPYNHAYGNFVKNGIQNFSILKPKLIEHYSKKIIEIEKYRNDWGIRTDENELREKYEKIVHI